MEGQKEGLRNKRMWGFGEHQRRVNIKSLFDKVIEHCSFSWNCCSIIFDFEMVRALTAAENMRIRDNHVLK